jgi:hypothetical protein
MSEPSWGDATDQVGAGVIWRSCSGARVTSSGLNVDSKSGAVSLASDEENLK